MRNSERLLLACSYPSTTNSRVSFYSSSYSHELGCANCFLYGCSRVYHTPQGAEPIYLHVIRPLLKPYTSTLDASLELLLMTGDFIFALSTFPIKLGLELWEKGFGFDPSYYYNTGILDTETETETTTDVSSELPEPNTTQTQRASPNRKPDEVKFPRKGARRPTIDDTHTHQPLASSSRTRRPLLKHDVEPNFYTTSGSASSTPSQQQKLKGRQHDGWYPPPSAYAGDDEHLQDSGTTTTASLIELDVQVTTEKQKLEDTEEWRQYPAFPSAYPPTPLLTSSRLVSTHGAIRTTTNMYPVIKEEDLKDAEEWRRYPAFPAAYPPTPLVVSGARLHGVGTGGSHPFVVKEEGEEGEGEDEERETRDGSNGPEQDFRGSLQPLREPLNPGFASDSSDSYRSSYGIQNQNDFLASSLSASAVPAVISAADTSSNSDSDVEIYSDVDEEEEEEDNFNITLQTPLQHPLPIPRNQRPVSMTSTLASVSTALTTVHDGSLRTRSSGSGSGGGEDDEMEGEEGEKENAATSLTTTPSSPSVLGKKRALQGQGDRGDVIRRAKGTESPHGHGKSGTKKRRVSTSQSPTRRQQGAGLTAFTTDDEGNVQFSSATEGRDAEQSQRARTPTPTNTKAGGGGRSRRRRAPLSPSRVNAPRSPLRVNTAPSPSRGNGTRSPLRGNAKRSPSRENGKLLPLRGNGKLSPLRGNRTLSPSRVNAITTRAVRPRVTRYATPPPLPITLGSMTIGAITTAPESTTTGAETTTENRTLVDPPRPDPILIPDKQTRRGFRPQVPIAQRSSRRLRSGESAAQARKPDSAALSSGDPDSVPPEQTRRRTTVNVQTARTTRK